MFMAFRTTIKNAGDLTTEHIAGSDSEFIIEATKFSSFAQQTVTNFTELRAVSTKSQIVNVIGTGSFERQAYVAQVDDNLNTVVTSDNLFAYVRHPGTINNVLRDGTSVATTGIRQIPGIEVDAGVTRFWHGDQTDTDVELTTNDSTAVLVQTFEGLEPSSFYRIKFGYEIVMWDLEAAPSSGRLTGLVGVKIATNPSSVATCTLAATFFPDAELDVALAGATTDLTATTGGLTMWATRPTGIVCRCSCAWWVTEFKRLVTT
jgi:hypothetical protein